MKRSNTITTYSKILMGIAACMIAGGVLTGCGEDEKPKQQTLQEQWDAHKAKEAERKRIEGYIGMDGERHWKDKDGNVVDHNPWVNEDGSPKKE